MFKEVMRSAGLVGFAEVGLVLFVCAFAMILLLAFFGMSKQARREVSMLPLADGLSEGELPDGMREGA